MWVHLKAHGQKLTAQLAAELSESYQNRSEEEDQMLAELVVLCARRQHEPSILRWPKKRKVAEACEDRLGVAAPACESIVPAAVDQHAGSLVLKEAQSGEIMVNANIARETRQSTVQELARKDDEVEASVSLWAEQQVGGVKDEWGELAASAVKPRAVPSPRVGSVVVQMKPPKGFAARLASNAFHDRLLDKMSNKWEDGNEVSLQSSCPARQ